MEFLFPYSLSFSLALKEKRKERKFVKKQENAVHNVRINIEV
jgi:hypothetical protein